jgi:hypothetical protein
MARDLFSPFVGEGRVDTRLLRVLGLDANVVYSASFDALMNADEGKRFDLVLEATNGRRIFIDVKPSGASFESCGDDERSRAMLAEQHEPYLAGRVDAKWLDPQNFFESYEIMRAVSYLGRYDDSGVAFIFPRLDDGLMKSDMTIKQIVSKTLAPRVAILYLEYLVERILDAVAGDEPLRRHYLAFRDRYVVL